MSNLQTKLPTDTWVVATWEEYIQAVEEPAYENTRGYYHNGQLRIEMTPVGPDHASDNGIISFAVNLFGSIKGIPLNGLINCSYRKVGISECQPDVSYYIGESAQLLPQGTSVVDLDRNVPPDLVIEVASTSLADDIGRKRLLYEDLGIAEYWIVDVANTQTIAFAIADGGSRRITQSQALPGLAISLLQEALRRSRQTDQAQVGAWLLAQFQQ